MPRTEERHLSVRLGGALLGLLSLPGWVLASPDRPVALVLLVGALYTAACLAAVPLAGERWPALRPPVCAGLLAAGWVILFWLGPQNPWVLLYALVVIAALLPLFWILALTGATMLGLLVWGVAGGDALGRVPDLHDILGHSLTTVAVKAGLARRVLDDVRATVDDYREVRLSVELSNAAEDRGWL